MSFSRWWTETVAAVSDVLPLPLVALLVLLVAALAAAGWYWFPAWLPRYWPRLRRPRLPRLRRPRLRLPDRRRRSRRPPVTAEAVDTDSEELPELPPATFVSAADRLAAAGDYAGAVRERLRGMVRELVDQQVVAHRPGWTVTELARAAGQARPTVADLVREAGRVFSDVWYGQQSAGPEHDARMRALADELHRALAVPATPGVLQPVGTAGEEPG